jgi:hypothetical protein
MFSGFVYSRKEGRILWKGRPSEELNEISVTLLIPLLNSKVSLIRELPVLEGLYVLRAGSSKTCRHGCYRLS